VLFIHDAACAASFSIPDVACNKFGEHVFQFTDDLLEENFAGWLTEIEGEKKAVLQD